MHLMAKLVPAALVVMGVVACSDDKGKQAAQSQQPAAAAPPVVAAQAAPAVPPPAPVQALPRLLDRFEVGGNVYVRALKVEPARNALWVGTSAGVNEVDLGTHQIRQVFTRKDGLANEYVFAVGLDHEGNKWFGTNSGGVSRYKEGAWKTFFPMHGLADYWVYAFDSQKDGTLWIGTWAGANKVDPQTGAFTTYVRELVNEWVYGIAVDSQDRVWFGTEGGITRYDGTDWVSWTHADGMGATNGDGRPVSKNTGLGTRERHDLGVLSGGMATYNPNYVFSVLIDPQDVLWAGTWGGGVARFDGENWQNFTEADGLAGNIVYSMAQGKDGVLWFGTNRGLSRFDGKSWHNYGRHEGFLNLDVYAIDIDPQGDVWVGTNGAVLRFGMQDKEDKS